MLLYSWGRGKSPVKGSVDSDRETDTGLLLANEARKAAMMIVGCMIK